MTNEQAKEILRRNTNLGYGIVIENESTQVIKEALDMAIKALEQQSSDDVMEIHTQGLAEGVRCAMCTNLMKSDRGCDGGCVVNEDMYKKVMDTIKNQMFSQPISDDCVSIAEVLNQLKEWRDCEFVKMTNSYHYLKKRIQSMPPVTPTRKSGLHWIERFDNESMWLECPHCHIDSIAAYNYCPNCGASFKEEKRGNSDGSN